MVESMGVLNCKKYATKNTIHITSVLVNAFIENTVIELAMRKEIPIYAGL